MKYFRRTLSLFCFCIILSSSLNAQTAPLDSTFDFDGKAETYFGNVLNQCYDIAIQNDGKIVAVGMSHNGSVQQFSVARFNTNGSLDSTFDFDGKVTTSFGAYNSWATSVVIQTDGKILVAGKSSSGTFDFTVIRYNTNGSLDLTFDGDGIAITPIGTQNDEAFAIALQTNGKIVLAGTSFNGSNKDFAVVRYNADGSLDNTFDTDGIVTTALTTNALDEAHGVAIQTDGKIVVVGYSYNVTSNDYAIVRYNTNGSLDNSFDTDGKVLTPIGAYSDFGHAVAIQTDGKILVSGASNTGNSYEVAIVRYKTNGSIDNSFDTDGIVEFYSGGNIINNNSEMGRSMLIQKDGKIVVAGFTNNNNVFATTDNLNFEVLRFFPNGAFDTDGSAFTSFGNYEDVGCAVGIQQDGKIVVGGYSFNGSRWSFALARYNTIDCNQIIAKQPKNAYVKIGDSAHFVIQTNFPNVLYQWEMDYGTGFMPLNNSTLFSGVSKDTFTMNKVTIWNNNLRFRCLILSNNCLRYSNGVTLYICGSITTQPINKTISVTQNAQFIIRNSDSLATFQWQANSGSGFQDLANSGQISGALNDTLLISNVSLTNQNQEFRCIVKSGICIDTSNKAILNVNPIGLNRKKLQSNFSLYPNPASNTICVMAPSKYIGCGYFIYDSKGTEISTGLLIGEKTSIELNELNNGIYYFYINQQNKQIFTISKQ